MSEAAIGNLVYLITRKNMKQTVYLPKALFVLCPIPKWRTRLFGFVAFAQLTLTVLAAELVQPVVNDKETLAPANSVQLKGWIGEAIVTCNKGRILGQSIPDLIQPFAERKEDKAWRSEFWGKWFTSAALDYRYDSQPELKSMLDQAVDGLLLTQTSDGAITTYIPSAEFSNWDTWGRKYTLLGLLSYYDLTKDERTLAAARRQADRVLEYFGPGKANIAVNGWWNGMAASSILEPMVLLYRRTGDVRYLDFAKYIVASWVDPKGPDLLSKALNDVPVYEMFPGPDPSKKGYMSGGSSKAYEMMSCYEGLVELYRATGEPKYFGAARMVFDNILKTEITVLGSGSSWERWCLGRTRQTLPLPEWMETCVTVTWLKFASQLLRVTGNLKYADEIERSAYNPLLAAQKNDGTWWCHYNPLEGQRAPAPEQCDMHMNCCVANGPRGLMLFPELAFMAGEAGPIVNFYEPASATIPSPSNSPVHFEIKSEYPREGTVEIAVRPERTETFTLSLRIPGWSKVSKVEVNGKPVPDIKAGEYVKLSRAWKSGDRVCLTLDFSTRVEKDPGGSDRVVVQRGPIVFAMDKRLTQNVPNGGMGKIATEPDGTVKAKVLKRGVPDGIRLAIEVPFDVNGKRVNVRLCDYASAGNTWSEASTLRVWLPEPLNLAEPFAGVVTIKPPK